MNDFPLHNADEGLDSVIILLVDDQPLVGEAVRRSLLTAKEIEFHFCADSTQAISEAQRIKPTVILQDLVMPGTDGLALLKEYRSTESTRSIPVIALSTKEDPNVKSRAFEAGANDYLVKLPDPIELIARIRYHSRSFTTAQRLDNAHRALRVSQQQLLDTVLVLQRANNTLERLTNSDGLTDLANRRHFDSFLESRWLNAAETGGEISLLMVDVDFFKLFNDGFGHLAGDDALKQVASAMREVITDDSFLPARYGGEEFAVILPNTSELEAKAIAESLRARVVDLNIPHSFPAPGSVVTVSIGLATLSPSGSGNHITLIELADNGLYLAKKSGRNQVGVFGAVNKNVEF